VYSRATYCGRLGHRSVGDHRLTLRRSPAPAEARRHGGFRTSLAWVVRNSLRLRTRPKTFRV